MKNFYKICLVVLCLSLFQSAFADEKIALVGLDTPNDKGSSISLTWELKDKSLAETALTIHVLRKGEQDLELKKIKKLEITAKKFTDKITMKDFKDYFYLLEFRDLDDKVIYKTEIFGPFQAKPQWFNTDKYATFIVTVLAILIILSFIAIAQKGKKLYLRPLAGVKAIEDAVGRATEMGKPMVYVPGIGTIDTVSTLASVSILSKVSETVAEYGARMIVPNYDPIVYTVLDEVVRNSYVKTGHPDAYNPDDVYFLTNTQFAYASGVSGLMAREKPAANFFLGSFYAESLILAEAGSMTGAIQIAGTDLVHQIPFFIVACDYTLIGEELYAAGAIMGDDAKLLGSVKGQDYVKLIAIALLLLLFSFKIISHLAGFDISGLETLLWR